MKIRILFFLSFTIINYSALAQLNFHTDSALNTKAFAELVKIVDVNQDGKNDLITATTSGTAGYSKSILVYIQDSLGRLVIKDSIAYDSSPFGSPQIAALDAADINNDGRTDIIIGYQSVIKIYFQNANGTFPSLFQILLPYKVTAAKIGDLNSDNLNDIAVIMNGSTAMKVYYQTATWFTDSTYDAESAFRTDLEIVDINGDGRNDIAYSSGGGPLQGIHMHFQNQNGVMVKDSVIVPFTSATENFVWSFDAADVNNDGWIDFTVAASSYVGNDLMVYNLIQDSLTHRFDSIEYIAQNRPPKGVKVADINCDGKQDIVVNYGSSLFLRVFERTDSGNFVLTKTGQFSSFNSTHPQPKSLSIGDLNNDGRPDIASVGLTSAVALAYNTSIPLNFNGIDTSVVSNAQFAFTKRYSTKFYIDTIVDTVPKYIITTRNYYREIDSARIDSVFIDSTFRRSGSLCNVPYTDTVEFRTIGLDSLVLKTDTQLFFIAIDTILYTSLAEKQIQKIGLYPNPVENGSYLTIRNNNNQVGDFEIYTIDGKLIKQEKLNTTNTVLIDIQPGLYLIKFYKKKRLILAEKLLVK